MFSFCLRTEQYWPGQVGLQNYIKSNWSGGGTVTCQETWSTGQFVLIARTRTRAVSCSLELPDVAARLEGGGYYQCSYYGEHD